MYQTTNIHYCREVRAYRQTSSCGTVHWIEIEFRDRKDDAAKKISVFCDDIEFDPMTIELRKVADDE